MRFLVALLVVLAILPAVSAWPWNPVTISSQSVVSVASGLNFELVYRIVGVKPMSCTISSYETSTGSPLPTGNLTPKSTAGKQTWDFRMLDKPANQIAKIACTDSCGDGVCQSGGSGDETVGTLMSGTSCPADCGCPGGQVFSAVQYWSTGGNGCMNACPVINDGRGYSQFCSGSFYVQNGARNNDYGCQYNVGERFCYTCSAGTYASTPGGDCNRYAIGDGVCRMDLSEPPGSVDCARACTYGSCSAPGTTIMTCQSDPDWQAQVASHPAYDTSTAPGATDSVSCDFSGCLSGSDRCVVDYSGWGAAS